MKESGGGAEEQVERQPLFFVFPRVCGRRDRVVRLDACIGARCLDPSSSLAGRQESAC